MLMELLFLLIFFFFIVLNVVIGLVSSRSKRRKAEWQKPREGEQRPELAQEGLAGSEKTATGKRREAYESFLEPQTADGIMQSMYEAVQEQERARSEALADAASLDKTHFPEEKAPLPGEKQAPEEEFVEPAVQVDQSVYPGHVPRYVKETRLDVQQPQQELDRTEPLQKVEIPLDELQAAAGSAWKYVEGLPSLQRAIVLAEILGPPRSLSERSKTD